MFSRAFVISALAAFAAAQSTVLTFTHVPNPVTDGQPQAITYATNDTVNPVTILLRQGPSNDLQTVQTLTTSATSGQYIWTPCASLPNGNDYALEILQNGQLNYFGPFSIQGATTGSGACSGLVSHTSSSASSTVASSTSSAVNATLTSTHSSSITGGALITTSSHASTLTAHNGTVTSFQLSSTLSSSSRTGTSNTSPGATFQTTGPAPTTGAAMAIATAGSPLALVLGAIAAVAMG